MIPALIVCVAALAACEINFRKRLRRTYEGRLEESRIIEAILRKKLAAAQAETLDLSSRYRSVLRRLQASRKETND